MGINEPPDQIFGKLMSISDELMWKYWLFLTDLRNSEVDGLKSEVESGALHPMEAKKHLACRIVERFHNRPAAESALEEFNLRFGKRDLDSVELPKVSAAELGNDLVSAIVTAYSRGFGIARSRSEVRRLLAQGSVQWRGEKITSPNMPVSFAPGEILRLDKTRAVRLN